MPLELLRSPGQVVGGEAATEARFMVRLEVGLSVLDFLFDGITISFHIATTASLLSASILAHLAQEFVNVEIGGHSRVAR